ncbi:hypothetical protein Egran_01842 [Elaphomyces granulatus]|uniref:Heterokaryon incompatibility domain-containing protein n=1 Tax=Elaphomyces granulatus TaxID=519963 RepID=A0A232M2T0_9EURO|nr:hypothetical protein Egran_01842 [Elaphomyces granulatus]
MDYLVLSHCWGDPTDEERKRFCTTPENYRGRKEGFSYNDLPKTFQDAVRVTRELDKKYLWIDSLCIIQGDKEDWKKEAKRMEHVFASAYCTIAASSASNWRDGFLERNLSPHPPGRDHFIIDSHFPKRLMASGSNRTVDFIQKFFEKYSRCGLTHKSDRDTAISGLVNRIERARDTEERYGVFNEFLSRLLLWKRLDKEKTDPIVYDGRRVPSWSWMAYDGEIGFMSDSALMVPRSEDLGFDLNRETLVVKIRQFEHCRMEQGEKEHAIFADSRRVGSLWFDMETEIEFRHCVVVGMREEYQKEDPQKIYYILLVREEKQPEERLGVGEVEAPEKKYERLGVGEVEACYVSKKSDTGKLV